jgi:hypothetical protein
MNNIDLEELFDKWVEETEVYTYEIIIVKEFINWIKKYDIEINNVTKTELNLTDEDIYNLCEKMCGNAKIKEVLKNKQLLKILKEVDK